jgi:uncharacterized Tic20 family protein
VPKTELYGSILSLGVAVVAVLLIVWQVIERRRRTVDPGSEDGLHFARQELRRAIVALVMLFASLGLFLGTRISPQVGGKPNLYFVEIWLVVFGLVIVLLILALVDWAATQRYARRHRQAIVKEGLDILRQEMIRRSALGSNGDTGEPDGGLPRDPRPS